MSDQPGHPSAKLMFEPEGTRYDYDRDAFILVATADGVSIDCAVSRGALEDYSKTKCGSDPMMLYREWEYPMRELAAAKHTRGQFGPRGSIVVRSGDGL